MDDDSLVPQLTGAHGDATMPGAGGVLAPPGGGQFIPDGGPDGAVHMQQNNIQYNLQRINYVHTGGDDERMAVDPADFDHLARAVTDNANSAVELHRSVAKITEGLQATDTRLQELTHLVSLVARAAGQTSESVTKAVSRSASPVVRVAMAVVTAVAAPMAAPVVPPPPVTPNTTASLSMCSTAWLRSRRTRRRWLD